MPFCIGMGIHISHIHFRRRKIVRRYGIKQFLAASLKSGIDINQRKILRFSGSRKDYVVDTENLSLEPSALAGMYGPVLIAKDAVLSAYPSSVGVTAEQMANAVHLIWATGGSMVPPEEQQQYYRIGKTC